MYQNKKIGGRLFLNIVSLTFAILLVLGTVSANVLIKTDQAEGGSLNIEYMEYRLIQKPGADDISRSGFEIIEEYDSFLLVGRDTSSNQLKTNSLTAEPFEKLDADLNNIYLKRKTIDVKEDTSIRNMGEEDLESGQYLVKAIGPIKSDWKRTLKKQGEILEYIPQNTYLIEMTSDDVKQVKDMDFVRWVGAYRPEYKVEKGLEKFQGEQIINIRAYEQSKELLFKLLRHGQLIDYNGNGVQLAVESNKIDDIAEIQNVRWIEKTKEMKILNDDAQWTVQSGESDSRPIWDHNLTGEGLVIGVADTGIDYDHAAFRDPGSDPIGSDHRKIVRYVEYADHYDGHGHGTHVAGSIAGNDEIENDSQPYDGIAKDAKLSTFDIGTETGELVLPPDFSEIFDPAYDDGARIFSNSWGADNSSYTSEAQQVDDYMWNNKDMLILYAAGNSGDSLNTVASPGSAKNILTIGASGNGDRESSKNDMASFSSRGPTDDGRLKPEIVAPGHGSTTYNGDENIISAKSDGNLSSDNNGYTQMQGTSMATPIAAGTAALVREYFTDGHYPSEDIDNPSAALIKAAMVNSAEEITGTGAYKNQYAYPNNDQGFGRIELDNTLVFNGDHKNLKVFDNKIGLDTGESESYTIDVKDSSEPLEITLAYTDYPGSPTASKALVNDLNLKVTAPNGSVYKGNVFSGAEPGQSTTGGEFDDLNPLENVMKLNPNTGEYKVEILAENVPQGPQPYALTLTGILDYKDSSSGPADADFENEPLFPEEEETVQFTDQSTSSEGDIVDWLWNFGDGDTSTVQNPTHTYEEAGYYDVNLIVTDENGSQDSEVNTLKVETPDYSDVDGGDTSYEYVTNVKFNGIDKDSGNNGGYADHTDSLSDTLTPGQTYELSVSAESGGYSQYVTVAIDWNQNYDLSDDQVIEVGHDDSEPATVTTDITVPEDLEEGQTRMRVLHQYNEYHYDPTSNQNFGETEDYTISIDGDEMNEKPTASFSYSPSSATTEDTIDFSDSSMDSDGSISSWSWDFGDGSTSTFQNPSHSYSSSGTYTVELTVTDDDGSTDKTTQDINVSEPANEAPSASFSYSPISPSTEESVQFNDNSTDSDGNISSWSWDFGDGDTSVQQNPSHSYSSSGNYTVELTVTDDDDTDDSASKEITISEPANEGPNASFSYSPNSPTTEDTIDFADDSTDPDGNISSWSWDFGDGSTSTLQNPSHNYTSSGTYTVYMTVEDDDGDSDTVTKDISVSSPNSQPTASFSYSPSSPTTEDTVQFTDESSDSDGSITSWDWSFGDYSSSTQKDPSHSYNSSGTYTVELTVTDDNGTIDTMMEDITIGTDSGGSYSSVDGGDTSYGEYITNVHFNGINKDSGDDGGYANHTESVTNSLTPGENYELSVTMSTSGYTEYATVVIDWNQDYNLSDNQVIEIGYGSSDPQTVSTTITVPSDAAEGQTRMRVMQEYSSYHTDPTSNQNYGETEDYTVSVETNESNEVPTASFSYSPTSPTTEDTIGFIDESTDSNGSIYSWSWSFGDGTSSTSQNPSHNYSSTGTYTVELTVTDDDGATNTTSQDITVESSGGSYSSVSGGDTSYGEYLTNVQLNGINKDSGDDGGYADYTGSITNDLEPDQSYTLSVTMSTGGYSDYVSVAIDWDQNYDLSDDTVVEVGYGSSDPQTVSTTITVPSDAAEGQTRMRVMQEYDSYHTDPTADQSYGETEDYTVSVGTSSSNSPPTASFSYSPTSPVVGESIQFTDGSSDSDGSISSWSWAFGDGTSSTSQNPTHSYSSSGTYTVELTVTDDDGATNTTSQDITVESDSGGSYSSVSGGDTSYGEYITNIQFNGINKDSGDEGGYADHTDSVSNSLTPGNTYELSVTMSTGGYTDYVAVVIDWNQDYDLSDNQVIEIGYGSSDPQTVSTTITVPSNAAEGQTRMRVMQEYDSYHTDPTLNQNYGETEDYTISVEESDTQLNELSDGLSIKESTSMVLTVRRCTLEKSWKNYS